ncbi:MAG TPA: lytic transglycosylase domain-containing protein [Burkholderiaceae bacterium]
MRKTLLLAACTAAALVVTTAACDVLPEAGHAAPAATAAALDVTPAPMVVPVAGKPVLWGYVDGAGVAHFAATKLDSRYSQVLRETEGPRVLGKTTGPESLLTWLEFSPDVKAMQPLLDEAARKSGVDEELLKAVITVESGYNAKAVSHAGAVGLMQLTPDTADRYATKEERRRPAAERLLDARTNILTGARMLADLTRRYGGIDIALAAWNAGEGTVRKAGGRMPAIAETEAHVHMVLELYWALLQRNLPQRAHRVELDGCAASATCS